LKQFVQLIPYARPSFVASAVVFIAAIAGFFVIGGIYTNTQARGLVEAMTPSVRTLCFAVITSTSTIIPLLLATLSLARRVDQDFDATFYYRVKIIGLLGAVALASATLLLLFISIPLTESENLRAWFRVVYVIVVLGAAWIASLLVSIVMTLYFVLMDILHTLVPVFSDKQR
jgi:hypothetical protein